MSEPSEPPPRRPRDYTRELGVVECFQVVIDQCPSGAVRAVAQRALEAVRGQSGDVLREQAWFVLSAIRGWRGERAAQVHRSLEAFLDRGSKPG